MTLVDIQYNFCYTLKVIWYRRKDIALDKQGNGPRGNRSILRSMDDFIESRPVDKAVPFDNPLNRLKLKKCV